MRALNTFLFILLLLSSTSSQIPLSRWDLRIGAGASFPGIRSITPVLLENEVNYTLNDLLTTSLGIDVAWGKNQNHESLSYLQGNLNLFVSPFKNYYRSDLRFGSGLSYWNLLTSLYADSGTSLDQIPIESYTYQYVGLNAVLEVRSIVFTKSMVGFKLLGQWYHRRIHNYAILLKYGFVL
ncbi:MAG: hypothetical protein KDC57_01950 [Saprospiraceae bacterium]|nr:hypothetical protein [Saprospiraceae bacterium]